MLKTVVLLNILFCGNVFRISKRQHLLEMLNVFTFTSDEYASFAE